jgi:predicted nucleic acid-binding protein
MSRILVDSNVLLDAMTEDEDWSEWSGGALERCAEESILCINPVVYAEVSVRFERIEELESALPRDLAARLPIPYEAAFLAGKCFLDYRRRGGRRSAPLPDFFIGAHAAVERMPLLTRDVGRYRTYFPRLRLITPA